MNKQLGISLLEILVVILISSFLVLGLTGLFAGNVKTSNVIRNMGVNTESGSFATLLVSKYLSFSGHVNYFRSNAYYDVIDKVVFGDSINGDSADANNGVYDVVVITYEALEPEMTGATRSITCSGSLVEPGDIIKEAFSVVNVADLGPTLQCSSENISAATAPVNALILPGVELFQVQYGVADEALSEGLARYVNSLDDIFPGSTTQEDVNDLIRTIRFKVVVNSNNIIGVGDKEVQIYDSATETVSASARTYGTTVPLNNANHSRYIRAEGQ